MEQSFVMAHIPGVAWICWGSLPHDHVFFSTREFANRLNILELTQGRWSFFFNTAHILPRN